MQQGDLNQWDSKKTYDIITSIDVLYHSAIENDVKVLRKFYNGLNVNGMLVLNLPAFDVLRRDHDKVVHTKRRYLKKLLCSLLEDMGFEIQVASYRLPHVYLIIRIQKLLHKFFPTRAGVSDVKKTSKLINTILSRLGNLENKYLLNIGSIPLGSSLFIVAVKK